jgi:hypothetical protein
MDFQIPTAKVGAFACFTRMSAVIRSSIRALPAVAPARTKNPACATAGTAGARRKTPART